MKKFSKIQNINMYLIFIWIVYSFLNIFIFKNYNNIYIEMVLLFLKIIIFFNMAFVGKKKQRYKLMIILNLVFCLTYSVLDYRENLIVIFLFIILDEILDYIRMKKERVVFILLNILVFIFISSFDYIWDFRLDLHGIIGNLMMYILIFFLIYFINKYKKGKEHLEKINKELMDFSFQEINRNILMKQNEISQMLHDSLGNQLVAMIMYINIIKRQTNIENDEFDELENLSNEALASLRQNVKQIREMKYNFNLEESLNYIFNKFDNLSIIHIKFENELVEKELSSEEKYLIFSIIREGLNNSVYHGHASKFYIKLNKDKQGLNLYVSDNGVGCKIINNSYGLEGIVNNVQKLGGSVKFQSKINEGFTIIVKIPK